jgi:hypothetical protein
LSLDDDPPVDNGLPLTEPASAPPAPADPFSFTADPAPISRPEPRSEQNSRRMREPEQGIEPKSSSQKKGGSKVRKEPLPTPFATTPEISASTDPFAFNTDPSPVANLKNPQPDRPAESEKSVPQKSKPKDSLPTNESAQAAGDADTSNDPFSFNGDEVATVPKVESRGKSNWNKKSNLKKPEAEAVDETKSGKEGEPQNRRYGKPGEPKSNKIVWLAGLIGFLLGGGGIAGVILFLKKEPEVVKTTTEKKEEPPATPPDPPKEDSKTAKKETTKKETTRKNAPGVAPTDAKHTAESTAAALPMLTLPTKLKSFEIRGAKEKQSLTQQPSQPVITVEVPFAKIKQFCPCPNRSSNDAVVVWQANPGFNGRGEILAVDTYNGSTGNKTDRFEFAGDGKEPKCDLAFDGKLFAAASDGKVTIWNLEEKSKALEGFDPYADKPDHKKAGLAAVYIPNNSNNFLTVSSAGAMHLFEIATKKQIGEYIPENGTPGRVVAGKNLAAEETRASVAVAVGGAIHQVSTLAPLSLSWKLPLNGDTSRSFGLAAVGTPGRIAYAFETDADKKKEKALLFCFPNKEPSLFRWQDTAGDPVSVNWAGAEFASVVTTQGVVWFEYDSEGKAFLPLAMAQLPNGKGLHATTERAHWYLIPNPKDPAKSLMLELATPIADLIDFRNAALNKQPLETLRLDDKGLWR